MKIIFFGTNHFSWLILSKLLEKSQHEIVAVVTQAASEREMKKNEYNHEVLFEITEKRKYPLEKTLMPSKATDPDFIKTINELKPDLFIVASYGQILKPQLLDIPKHGAINVHPSLLPKYRGASPVQWAILNGDKTTGITFIKMTPGMDDGPILFQKELDLDQSWTSLEALDFFGRQSANELLDMLNRANIEELISKAESQDENEASFCPIIKKEMGKLSFTQNSSNEIIRMLRAFQPWPGIYLEYNGTNTRLKAGTRVKIHEIKIFEEATPANIPLGDFYSKDGSLYLKTKDLPLFVHKLQVEGKNPLSGEEFIKGYLN